LLLLAGAARRNSRLPDKTARDAVDDLMVLGILKSKTELADTWEESLRDVGKLFPTPPLQKCATVSGFFRGVVQFEHSTPCVFGKPAEPWYKSEQ